MDIEDIFCDCQESLKDSWLIWVGGFSVGARGFKVGLEENVGLLDRDELDGNVGDSGKDNGIEMECERDGFDWVNGKIKGWAEGKIWVDGWTERALIWILKGA